MPKKLDNCVKQVVKQQQKAGKNKKDAKSSAYAICSSSTGYKRKKGGGWKKEKEMTKESKEQKLVTNFIHKICEKSYAEALETMNSVVNEKIKNKIRKVTEEK